jgi:site-specific DNA-methyltransferase (adenine-specific)
MKLPTPYYDHDGITIYHADCRDVLPIIEPGSVDLVLTDPPYGISHQTDFRSRGRGALGPTSDFMPVHGDTEPFNPIPLLKMSPCILWGANYYADKLPTTNSWLVWDKREQEGVGVNDQADGELAWSNATKGVRIFRHMWNGMWRASEKGQSFHPTQKPVALMRWAIGKTKLKSGLVLDPYMGSGPVAVSCQQLGFRYVGIEIEERYCEIAVKRLAQQVLPFGDAA